MRVPTGTIDYTNKDYEGFRQSIIDYLKATMPEYTDLRQSDAGIVIAEAFARGLDILSMYQDKIANEAYLTTAEQRSSIYKWCKMLAYTPQYASSAKFKQVFVLSSVQNTNTVIPAGTVVKTNSGMGEDEVKFEVATDHTIPSGMLGNEKDAQGKYLYLADIVQGTTVRNELVGGSNGEPNQSFQLGYKDVVVDSLVVTVDEGHGFLETWQYRESFIDATAGSKVYTITIRDDGGINVNFGNGVFGKIPEPIDNNIYAMYRVGGGVQGNVQPNKINVMGTSLALVKSTFNPDFAYEIGLDVETIDSIKLNAPVQYRNFWGALTLDDFSEILLAEFPIIRFAQSKRDPNNVDNLYIYILRKDMATLPTAFVDEINRFFDENLGGRKVVGADQIFIRAATFTTVNFAITMVVEDRYSRAAKEQDVRDYLTNYFKVGNYPFATDLVKSELAAEILADDSKRNIAGIKSLRITTPTQDVLVPSDVSVIFTLGTVTFTTTGGFA